MPDDLSLGEVQRNMARHEREMEAIRTQVTTLARESVTVTQFAHELGSLRRELSMDRSQSEKLAEERHKTMIERLDSMEKNTGERIKALETRESSRPMNAWMKFSIISATCIGFLGIVLTIISAIIH